MSQNTPLRKGAVGALMDEYERAALELARILQTISIEAYEGIVDPETKDENCRSIQTIMSHVVSSGYGYADYLREKFGIPSTRPQKRLLSKDEAATQIHKMLEYTVETLAGRWEMQEDEITGTVVNTRWGVTYDMEQLLEHAIVHILRHRRQVQRYV